MTHLALCAIFLIGQWHEENMEINYVQENPKALLRHEHSARMRLLLEETLGTFNGYFFVTLYLNAAVQRVSFGYVTRSSINDVHFRLHILQPYAEPGKEASNYFNFHTFIMPRSLCYSRNCQCPLEHSELIEYSKSLPLQLKQPMRGTKCTQWELLIPLVMMIMLFFNSREVTKIKNFPNIY